MLDVAQIARWAGCIGNRTTIVPIADAKHDVFLSLSRTAPGGLPRAGQLAGLTTWRRITERDTIRTGLDRGPLRPRDHRNRFGQHAFSTERYADMKRVAICEQGVFGGTCLNVGCIPTKMFVYAAEVAESTRDSARYGVDAHVDERALGRHRVAGVRPHRPDRARRGELQAHPAQRRGVRQPHPVRPTQPDGRYALRTDDGDEFTADKVVIAAGSRASRAPAIADCGVRYYTSDTIMRIPELPEHLVIVGGGFVAAEFAHVFSALGVRVTIVVRGSTLLRGHDDTI